MCYRDMVICYWDTFIYYRDLVICYREMFIYFRDIFSSEANLYYSSLGIQDSLLTSETSNDGQPRVALDERTGLLQVSGAICT